MPEREWAFIELAALSAYQCLNADAETFRAHAGYGGLNRLTPDTGATRYDDEIAWNFTDET